MERLSNRKEYIMDPVQTKLIRESSARKTFRKRVLGALSLHYNFVPIEGQTYSTSAQAGNLYDYLAKTLSVGNNSTFQKKVKTLLVEKGLAKRVYCFGRFWFKGLRLKDPEEETELIRGILDQHYKDRENYRQRQRDLALRSADATQQP